MTVVPATRRETMTAKILMIGAILVALVGTAPAQAGQTTTCEGKVIEISHRAGTLKINDCYIGVNADDSAWKLVWTLCGDGTCRFQAEGVRKQGLFHVQRVIGTPREMSGNCANVIDAKEGYWNLRTGPSSQANIVRRVYPVDQLLAEHTEGKWTFVRGKEVQGWISSNAIQRYACNPDASPHFSLMK
jgi:hypothetical protein